MTTERYRFLLQRLLGRNFGCRRDGNEIQGIDSGVVEPGGPSGEGDP